MTISTDGAREERELEERDVEERVYYPEGGDQQVSLYRSWLSMSRPGGLLWCAVEQAAKRGSINAKKALSEHDGH